MVNDIDLNHDHNFNDDTNWFALQDEIMRRQNERAEGRRKDKVYSRLNVKIADLDFDHLNKQERNWFNQHKDRDKQFRDLTLGIDNLCASKRMGETIRTSLQNATDELSEAGIGGLGATGRYRNDLYRLEHANDNTLKDLKIILDHPELDDLGSPTLMKSELQRLRQTYPDQDPFGVDQSENQGLSWENQLADRLPDYFKNSKNPGNAISILTDVNDYCVDIHDPSLVENPESPYGAKYVKVMDSINKIENDSYEWRTSLQQSVDDEMNDPYSDIEHDDMFKQNISKSLHTTDDTVENTRFDFHNPQSPYFAYRKSGSNTYEQDSPSFTMYRAFDQYQKNEFTNDRERHIYNHMNEHYFQREMYESLGGKFNRIKRSDIQLMTMYQDDPDTKVDNWDDARQRLEEHMKLPAKQRLAIARETKANLKEAKAIQKQEDESKKKDAFKQIDYDHGVSSSDNVAGRMRDANGQLLDKNASLGQIFQCMMYNAFQTVKDIEKSRQADIDKLGWLMSHEMDPLSKGSKALASKITHSVNARDTKKLAQDYMKYHKQRKQDAQLVTDSYINNDLSQLNTEQQQEMIQEAIQFDRGNGNRDYHVEGNRFGKVHFNHDVFNDKVNKDTPIKESNKNKNNDHRKDNEGPEL